MNEFLKLLQDMNMRAFRFVKRQEYKLKAYIFNKKILKEIKQFEKHNPHAISTFEKLHFEDVPNRIRLNQYLREHFDNEYPKYIEVIKPNPECGLMIYFFEMIWAGDVELKGAYKGLRTFNFKNMEGKNFAYTNKLFNFEEYADYKAHKIIELAGKEGIKDKEDMVKRFIK